MKSLVQHLSNGRTEIVSGPDPVVTPDTVVIQTSVSLISAGTERMLVEFGKANLLAKARKQPEKVQQVLDKIRTDGLLDTLSAVKSKLDTPIQLGYSNVGVVLGKGTNVVDLKVGDRVVSNGPHAEIVRVPRNLVAKVPGGVSDENAAFTVIASIALQGIRLANPTLGESVAVIGTGVIGLLTVQLLVAQGCKVLALDFDKAKLKLAEQFGATTCCLSEQKDPVPEAMAFSADVGLDAVLITAATESSEPISQAAQMSRKRGKIVLIGVTGLELNRAEFYEKELSFQVSCSYGPGRYDEEYEQLGKDYPLPFVRWTENRNFTAILDLMQAKRIEAAPLITSKYKFSVAADAYTALTNHSGTLGILLEYECPESFQPESGTSFQRNSSAAPSQPGVGFIGSGNYASRILIPAFKAAGARLDSLVTQGSVDGVLVGKKVGFESVTTDLEQLLNNDNIQTIVIATRHDSHARYVVEALNAGKNVFVEKPLCLRVEELNEIKQVYESSPALLMVGFNRRFSPLVQKLKLLLGEKRYPATFVMTVNAGALPGDHWLQQKAVGGGRLIGEACHFIDLLRYLSASPITSSQVTTLEHGSRDTFTINLDFQDKSIGTIHYLSDGSKKYPKERLEVFARGGVLQLNNFRQLIGYGWPGFRKTRLLRQNKGQAECVAKFMAAVVDGGMAPIPVDEIVEVAEATIELGELQNL